MGSSYKTHLARSRIIVVESNVLIETALIYGASGIRIVLPSPLDFISKYQIPAVFKPLPGKMQIAKKPFQVCIGKP
jgi:hypothetical protein